MGFSFVQIFASEVFIRVEENLALLKNEDEFA